MRRMEVNFGNRQRLRHLCSLNPLFSRGADPRCPAGSSVFSPDAEGADPLRCDGALQTCLPGGVERFVGIRCSSKSIDAAPGQSFAAWPQPLQMLQSNGRLRSGHSFPQCPMPPQIRQAPLCKRALPPMERASPSQLKSCACLCEKIWKTGLHGIVSMAPRR